jgi:WhiB family redox-sensing transcriptional regulator
MTRHWMSDAACRNTDLDAFYPEPASNASVYADGQRICRGCPVQNDCLTYALDNDERYGLWGGLTPAQRETHPMRARRGVNQHRHTISHTDAEWLAYITHQRAEGRSLADIAAQTGMLPRSVERRTQKARQRLANTA